MPMPKPDPNAKATDGDSSPATQMRIDPPHVLATVPEVIDIYRRERTEPPVDRAGGRRLVYRGGVGVRR